MPWTFSCQLPRAVSTSTGIVRPASRQRRSSVRPSTLGQPEVEHDGVVALGLPEEVGALAVGGAVDRVAGLAERRRELLREPRFVFDDQHPTFPSFRLKAEATRSLPFRLKAETTR